MPWQTLVSAETVAARLGDPRLLVFDCRYELMQPDGGRAAYAASHLPGAIHADLHHDLAVPATPRSGRHPLPAPESFAARLRGWGVNDDSLRAGLRRRDWHVGVTLLVDDGEMAGAPRTSPCWKADCAAGAQLGLPVTADLAPPRPAGNFSPRLHAAAVGRRGHDRRRGCSIPAAACSMHAHLSVIGARSSRSILSRATSPVRATNPRVAASTQTAVSCPSPNCARCSSRAWMGAAPARYHRDVRLGRHGLSFAAGDGRRRPARRTPVCGQLERMVT